MNKFTESFFSLPNDIGIDEKMEYSGHVIPIIVPSEHKFILQKEIMKEILGAAEIKDRQIAVVSIAGAFRKGKSFLLNFFLKYLYAKVRIALLLI